MTKLQDLLVNTKSKNSGPLELTIDLYFKDDDSYQMVKKSPSLNPDVLADLYTIPREDVLGIFELDALHVIKIAMKRPIPAGHRSDSDASGSQQHLALLSLMIED